MPHHFDNLRYDNVSLFCKGFAWDNIRFFNYLHLLSFHAFFKFGLGQFYELQCTGTHALATEDRTVDGDGKQMGDGDG